MTLALVEPDDDYAGAPALPAGDYIPRLLVMRPAADLAHGAPAIVVVWHPAGAWTASQTVYAADTDENRNPARWREELSALCGGPVDFRLWSHPDGVDTDAGYRRRRNLGGYDHDQEAPDVVRHTEAAPWAGVMVDGLTERARLVGCPDGVPVYALPDVCETAKRLREWRRARPVVVGESTRPVRGAP